MLVATVVIVIVATVAAMVTAVIVKVVATAETVPAFHFIQEVVAGIAAVAKRRRQDLLPVIRERPRKVCSPIKHLPPLRFGI